MKKLTIIKLIKQSVASIGWWLFMWGNETNEESYWEEIYHQELNFRSKHPEED